ncbi:HutD/Ves family protein [Oryzicola mucosus]|uniref:HutD family protein n=1 Tax=Oryzicola mucosus TaxID=2767425 RepID=A0A8J6TYW1_9HYPH|nr:HutD family protein [Oryzicola mucosus]
MRRLRAESYRRMLWKNGGGETAEILAFPANASVSDFGWRISMATVASDGPFSVFEGIDRTLSILDGEGMALDIEGMGSHVLTKYTNPLSFLGDAPTWARLTNGPIVDLNVMTRRSHCRHRVRRLALSAPMTIVTTSAHTAIFATDLCHVEGLDAPLRRFDCLVCDASDKLVSSSGPSCSLFVVEIDPI